jgi:hypothetical protein
MPTIMLPTSLVRNGKAESSTRLSIEQLGIEIRRRADELIVFAEERAIKEGVFKAFESSLIPLVFEFARVVVMLFLAIAERHEAAKTPERVFHEGRAFRRRPAQARNLSTFFGVVRYWRTYMRAEGTSDDRSGFHPLDVALGLTADRISFYLLSLSARLATKLSFAQARAVLCWFLRSAPSTEVIEQAVLGLGRHTGEWFDQASAPRDDGEVLVTQIDSKASPTATDTELARRRGKRRPNRHPESQRHRGRYRRARYGAKPRRKKGDKSKNGRMATIVVQYTLRRRGKLLIGPINKKVYASFAPKRHAFEVARREADKRASARTRGEFIKS